MAVLARWDPFRELEEIGERFNRVFNRQGIRESGQEAVTVPDWVPPVDIVEDDKEYVIKAEIPEVDRSDVKVMAQDGVLVIQGERKKQTAEQNKRMRRVERIYGTFTRSFTLPEGVAEEGIKANFKDGMLYVHLAKTEKAKAKAIEVKVQ